MFESKLVICKIRSKLEEGWVDPPTLFVAIILNLSLIINVLIKLSKNNLVVQLYKD